MRYFYAVVAQNGEVMSTHPAHAARAALAGLAGAEREERNTTDFPREMFLERWYYLTGEHIHRKERVNVDKLIAKIGAPRVWS